MTVWKLLLPSLITLGHDIIISSRISISNAGNLSISLYLIRIFCRNRDRGQRLRLLIRDLVICEFGTRVIMLS